MKKFRFAQGVLAGAHLRKVHKVDRDVPARFGNPGRRSCVVSTFRRYSLLAVLEVLGLALLVAAGWSMRSGLSLTALSDGDTWGFLMPAFSFLGGEGIVDVQQREWIYSAFVGLALKATGSFEGLISIQQGIGMLGAILLWLTWKTWVSLLPQAFLLRVVAAAAGLLAVAVYLLNPHLIFFERSIRPEVLMVPAALAQLLCMVLFCKYRWAQPSAGKAILTGMGTILFAFVVFKLKPSWALAVPVTVLPVFWGILGQGLTRTTRLAAPILGIAVTAALVWLPQKVLFVPGDEPRTILPLTLFTMNADSIRDSMAKRLAGGNLSEEQHVLYQAILPLLEEELEKARTMLRHYPKVGFDPDYLIYQASIFPTLVHRHGLDPGGIAAFCNTAYSQAWIDEPLGMTRKIFTQFTAFVFPDPLTFSRKRIKLREHYAHSAKVLPDGPAGAIPPWVAVAYQDHQASLLDESSNSEAIIRPASSLHRFLDRFGGMALPLELVFMAALGASLLLGSLRDFRLPGLVALLLFGAPAANAFTIAAVHALDNSRYRASYGPLLFLALMAMLIFALGVLGWALGGLLTKKGRLSEKNPVADQDRTADKETQTSGGG